MGRWLWFLTALAALVTAPLAGPASAQAQKIPVQNVPAQNAPAQNAQQAAPEEQAAANPEAREPAAAAERLTFEVRREEVLDLSIDGRIEEEAWRRATPIPLPFEYFPGDGDMPPVRTEARVLFDRRQLYVAFRAFDPDPSKIRAHLMDRDETGTFNQDDHVILLVDSFNDQRRAFQFRVNPFGVQVDALVNGIEDTVDPTWDVVWRSACAIDAEGWSAELAIPFHQLRFPDGDEPQTWGFEFERSYPRSIRYGMTSAYRDPNESCALCQINRLEGFEGMGTGRNLELAPTLTWSRTDSGFFPDFELVEGDDEFDAGLSARWSPNPNLTFNATLNPDFSQVEADNAQLEVNERFALFFPERRPFFVEGVDIFGSPISTVFTRTVIDPEWGLKLTGKSGASAYGLFTALDEINGLTLPRNDGSTFTSIDEEVLTTVGRWRRDIGEASSLGLMYTGREGDGDYRNRTFGLDASFELNGRNTVSMQGVLTDTRYPDELAAEFGQPLGDFGGHAVQVVYQHSQRDWAGSLGYRNFGRGYRADAGFTPRADFETWRASLSRIIRPETPKSWFSRLTFDAVALSTRNQDGVLTDQRLEIGSTYQGPLQSEVIVSARLQDEIAGDGVQFSDLPQWDFFFEIQPTGNARFVLFAEGGDDVDFTNVREAESLVVNPVVELKLGNHLNAQLDWLHQELDVSEGRLVRGELGQAKLVYQFNTRTFLRAIFQYVDVDYAAELYLVPAPPDIEQLFTQLLFSYTVNPQTVLFAGYTETRLGLEG
ncbi:MAG: DUF5916 domain-containing protein, partial [Acidobacteriota bacterium]